MRRLWRWLGTTAASFGLLVTGGGVAQQAIDLAGLDDAALGQAFREAFGIGVAQAQTVSFYAIFDARLAALGPAPLRSEIQAALVASIAAFVAAGGTALPSPAELAAAYPGLPDIATAFVAALQTAVLAGIIDPVFVQLALAGDLS